MRADRRKQSSWCRRALLPAISTGKTDERVRTKLRIRGSVATVCGDLRQARASGRCPGPMRTMSSWMRPAGMTPSRRVATGLLVIEVPRSACTTCGTPRTSKISVTNSTTNAALRTCADDVPGVDVDHHVAVEIAALDGAGECSDVPALNLPRPGGLQPQDPAEDAWGCRRRSLTCRVALQRPVHRGNRTQVGALGEQCRGDVRWRPVHEPRGVDTASSSAASASDSLFTGNLPGRGVSSAAWTGQP